MIRSFAHKGLEALFRKGSKGGIRPNHAEKLLRQLSFLNIAKMAEDMDYPGWRLHRLRGKLAGHWSVWVSGNWRLTFRFAGEDAVDVDYQDYH